MADKAHYDLIILGAGPAGMTAGVYAARKQVDTLVITENVGGQATWSSGIENYLGYTFITGTELVAKFEDHVRSFNVQMLYTRVAVLAQVDGGFRVETTDGDAYTARSVIVATGKNPRTLDVPGEREFTGKGVTYCATCDGPLFSGMEVAVVGGGNSGLDAVIQMMKICPKVYLIEVMDELRADEVVRKKAREASNVEILTKTAVTRIDGANLVESVSVRNLETGETRVLPVKGVFVEVGLAPSNDFLRGLVRLNKYGEVPVDCAAQTGVPGLFAAGDVTDVPEKQIICAAGDGAKAALGAYSYLVRLPVAAAADWGEK